MSQSLFGVRFAAALFAMTCVASVAAQRADPRDIPPSEDRLLNGAVPDIQLTTATGARIDALAGRARATARAGVRLYRCGGVFAVPDVGGRPIEQSTVALLATGAQLRSAGHHVRHVRLRGHHHALSDNDDWTFAVAEPQDVRRLAEALGFCGAWTKGGGV